MVAASTICYHKCEALEEPAIYKIIIQWSCMVYMYIYIYAINKSISLYTELEGTNAANLWMATSNWTGLLVYILLFCD